MRGHNLLSRRDLTPKVLACGGSWMVKSNLIAEGKFEQIAKLTREAVELVKQTGDV